MADKELKFDVSVIIFSCFYASGWDIPFGG